MQVVGYSTYVNWITVVQNKKEIVSSESNRTLKWSLYVITRIFGKHCVHTTKVYLNHSHREVVDWYMIPSHQTLSESFIEHVSDKVSWHAVSRYQSYRNTLQLEIKINMRLFRVNSASRILKWYRQCVVRRSIQKGLRRFQVHIEIASMHYAPPCRHPVYVEGGHGFRLALTELAK